MRFIGLDIGRDFAHVAVVEGSETPLRLPRFAMGDDFRSFAATLGPDDAVALEASTNTWAIADLLGRHAGRVVVSNPLRTKAIASAKRKTDDIDAATLAELLAADYLPPVWQPDPATRRLRRLVSHRAGLVHDRTAVRNRGRRSHREAARPVPRDRPLRGAGTGLAGLALTAGRRQRALGPDRDVPAVGCHERERVVAVAPRGVDLEDLTGAEEPARLFLRTRHATGLSAEPSAADCRSGLGAASG